MQTKHILQFWVWFHLLFLVCMCLLLDSLLRCTCSIFLLLVATANDNHVDFHLSNDTPVEVVPPQSRQHERGWQRPANAPCRNMLKATWIHHVSQHNSLKTYWMAKKYAKTLEQDCIGGIALKRTHMDQQKDSRDAENLFKPWNDGLQTACCEIREIREQLRFLTALSNVNSCKERMTCREHSALWLLPLVTQAKHSASERSFHRTFLYWFCDN